MGVLDWLVKPPAGSSAGLFNAANQHWQAQQKMAEVRDEDRQRQELLEVIRLCQQAIQASRNEGDAYVLLANAFIASSSLVEHDELKSALLLDYAAAAVQKWWTLPYNKYPVTKNYEVGVLMYERIANRIQQTQKCSQSQVDAFMADCCCTYGDTVICPGDYEIIQKAIRQVQPLPGDAEANTFIKSGEKDHNPCFCEFVSSTAVLEYLAEKHQNQNGFDLASSINALTFHLSFGVRLAGKYPEKAKVVLSRELGQPPSDDLQRSLWELRQHLMTIMGEEAVLQNLRAEYTAYFQKASEEHNGSQWVFGKALSIVGAEALEQSVTSATTMQEALFSAIKDGIAFGLFSPSHTPLEEFSNVSREKYNRDPHDVDGILDMLLDQYEAHYGAIA